jgi:hypothetical protein
MEANVTRRKLEYQADKLLEKDAKRRKRKSKKLKSR